MFADPRSSILFTSRGQSASRAMSAT